MLHAYNTPPAEIRYAPIAQAPKRKSDRETCIAAANALLWLAQGNGTRPAPDRDTAIWRQNIAKCKTLGSPKVPVFPVTRVAQVPVIQPLIDFFKPKAKPKTKKKGKPWADVQYCVNEQLQRQIDRGAPKLDHAAARKACGL